MTGSQANPSPPFKPKNSPNLQFIFKETVLSSLTKKEQVQYVYQKVLHGQLPTIQQTSQCRMPVFKTSFALDSFPGSYEKAMGKRVEVDEATIFPFD